MRESWARMPSHPLEEDRNRRQVDAPYHSETASRAVADWGRGGIEETRGAQETLCCKCQKGGSQGPKRVLRRSLHLPALGQVDENDPHFAGNGGPRVKKLACD